MFNLDSIVVEGVVFICFYVVVFVCLFICGSCLIGCYFNCYGIFSVNVGYLLEEEFMLVELFKVQGYFIGYFGKWYLGMFICDMFDVNWGGKLQFVDEYVLFWLYGFEICFFMEFKVFIWNFMCILEKVVGGVGSQGLGNYFGIFYWNEQGECVENNLKGDDSCVIMDWVIDFIIEVVDQEEFFFVVIWFYVLYMLVVVGLKYLV